MDNQTMAVVIGAVVVIVATVVLAVAWFPILLGI